MARRKGKEYLATIMTSIAPIAICGRIRGYNRERVLKEAKNYAKELGKSRQRGSTIADVNAFYAGQAVGKSMQLNKQLASPTRRITAG